MEKNEAVFTLAQAAVFIMLIAFLPGSLKEGITEDNITMFIMLLASLSIISAFFTNMYTKIRNKDNPINPHSIATIKRWSWINSGIQLFCAMCFSLLLWQTIAQPSINIFWKIICAAWIFTCLFTVYKEMKLRRRLTGNE